MAAETVITSLAGVVLALVAYLGREVRADVRELQRAQTRTTVTLTRIATHLNIPPED